MIPLEDFTDEDADGDGDGDDGDDGDDIDGDGEDDNDDDDDDDQLWIWWWCNHNGFPRFLVAGGPTGHLGSQTLNLGPNQNLGQTQNFGRTRSLGPTPDPNDTWAAASSTCQASSGFRFLQALLNTIGNIFTSFAQYYWLWDH